MSDAVPRTAWRGLMLYLALMAGVIFIRLLPLGSGAGGLPTPDVMLAITFAWVLRRPEAVPALAVAGVFLMADILFMRPLGLWAAAAVLGTQTLRARAPALRDARFAAEWLAVAAVSAAMTFATAAILGLLVVDQPAFGQTLLGLIATILAYPVAVGLAARPFGLRKSAPGDDRSMGYRA